MARHTPLSPSERLLAGTGRVGILPYNFYNAGLQVFDVSDPTKPRIAAYSRRRSTPNGWPSSPVATSRTRFYVEYDRNLFWLFTNHGFYVLSSPLLGEPNLAALTRVWLP